MQFKDLADKKIVSLEHALGSQINSVIDYSCISIRIDHKKQSPEEERNLMDAEAYFYKGLKTLSYNSAFFGQYNECLFSKVTEDVRDAERWLAHEFKRSNNSLRRNSIRESRRACKASWLARKNFRRNVLGKHTIDFLSPEVLPQTERVYCAAKDIATALSPQSGDVVKNQREIEGCALNFALAWGLPRPTQLITGYAKFSQLYHEFYARHDDLAKKHGFSPDVEPPKIVFLDKIARDLQRASNGESESTATRSLMVFE